MIWILVLLFILIIIQVIIIGVCFSNLALNIKECEISYNTKIKDKLEIIKSKVSIDVYLSILCRCHLYMIFKEFHK